MKRTELLADEVLPSLPGKTEQARAAATRAALISAARELFGLHGYQATGTNDLVARAAVTRGALYHHFATKEDLFAAVWRQVARELSEAAEDATRDMPGKSWQRVMAAVRAYLTIVADRRDVQRILLLDGPSVLGWERWRDLQVECRLSAWVGALETLAELGIVAAQPMEPLAHLILAVLDDAALTVAHADSPAAALPPTMAAVETLLGGLRLRG